MPLAISPIVLPLSYLYPSDTLRAWLGRSTVVPQLLLPSSPVIPLGPTVPYCGRKQILSFTQKTWIIFLSLFLELYVTPGKLQALC